MLFKQKLFLHQENKNYQEKIINVLRSICTVPFKE